MPCRQPVSSYYAQINYIPNDRTLPSAAPHSLSKMLLSAVTRMAALLLTCSIQQVLAVDQTRDPGLIAKLNMAATQLDRLTLLGNDEKDWTFTFTDQKPFYNFSPGGVINMNAATFPAARGNGLTCKSQFRICSHWTQQG